MGDKKKWAWKLPGDFKIRNLKKDQILIILLAGILLLVIAIPSGKSTKNRQGDNREIVERVSAQPGQANEYTAYMEQHLEEVLTQMEGAGEVTVMVTLSSSAEQIVEKDTETQEETVTETDSQGGMRTTTSSTQGATSVYDSQGSTEQSPYISKELMPKVEGVVVIAEGGDNAVVVKNITEAIQALFGIDTHKIRIVKKN